MIRADGPAAAADGTLTAALNADDRYALAAIAPIKLRT